ncbi:Uma2 family endonuclease [Nocardia wallacei]|uniref:Uma2 family endonuclease n=1 Tax=Nocardia wallacei TaxID=480035 RepID=UPI00313BA000
MVWVRRGSGEHQMFIRRLTNALELWTRKGMAANTERCWVADFETNIFFGSSGKSDFMTPDFMIHRCLGAPYQAIRASDVLLAGEVLSPSNSQVDIEGKKPATPVPEFLGTGRCTDDSAIDAVHAFALETRPGLLPEGVRPLRPANYLAVGEWTADDVDGIAIDHPFPIHIPWSELEF